MAKKKSKPAKKVAKPTKKAKAVAKKPAKKVVAKKSAPKKVVKKVVAKKATPKKTTKKIVAKKAAPKKPIKKAIAKKVAPKTVAKKVVKATKPIAKAKTAIVKKSAPAPIAKKVNVAVKKAVGKPLKKEIEMDLDEVSTTKKQNKNEEDEVVFEYVRPSVRKPLGPTPKPQINKDNRSRYSDEELVEFKGIILKKLTEAQKDYDLLKSTLSHKDDHGTDDTSPTFKLLEDGSEVMTREETAQLAGRQEKFIQNLKNALIRIENKSYGICRATGRLISKERLRSVPHATLSIDAKLGQN